MMENTVQLLRSQLEARLATPAVIIVTSAEKHDGKSVTAFALARSFAGARYRSIVIDANPSHSRPSYVPTVGDVPLDRIGVASRAVQNLHGSHYELALANEKDVHLLALPQIKELLEQCRLRYEYTIVDCSEFEATGLPGLLAKCADVALISAREGRRCTELDTHLVQSVEASGAPVFGVVLVPNAAMRLPASLNGTAPESDSAAEKQVLHSGGLAWRRERDSVESS
jgi:Mrp family chromosome partitioning ATPase